MPPRYMISVLNIIRAARDHDWEKARIYSEFLAKQMDEAGDDASAARVRRVLNREEQMVHLMEATK